MSKLDDASKKPRSSWSRDDWAAVKHLSPWEYRSYNSGKWQVYVLDLIHVVEVTTQNEAKNLCNNHNHALKLAGE